VFLLFMTVSAISDLTTNLEDYKVVTGTIQSTRLVTFQEREEGRFLDKTTYHPNVVMKLQSGTTFFIDQSDYGEFFPALLTETNLGKSARFYVRMGPYNQYNPMQIEIDNKVILPYSFHQKWQKYMLIAFLAGTGLFLWLLIKFSKIARKRRGMI